MRFPKMPHLPWSPGTTEEDVVAELETIQYLKGERVVVTEKMEGENVRLTKGSMSGRHTGGNSSFIFRRWLKGFWSSFKDDMEPDDIIWGENMWAALSIHYRDLPSFFMGHMVANGNDRDVLSWEDTRKYFDEFGIVHSPVIYEGPLDKKMLEEAYATYSKRVDRTPEGFVVRLADGFSIDDFDISVFKWVRPGYKKTIGWEKGPYFQNMMKE